MARDSLGQGAGLVFAGVVCLHSGQLVDFKGSAFKLGIVDHGRPRRDLTATLGFLIDDFYFVSPEVGIEEVVGEGVR